MTLLAPSLLQTRGESPEVRYAVGDPVLVGASDLMALQSAALASNRRRARICTHASPEDPLHEMVIVLARGTYVRPHRHVGKTESFSVFEGEADVVLFHDDGTVRELIPLGPLGSNRIFHYRLAQPVFHTVIVRTATFSFLEVTNGPFRAEQTIYAPWSPDGRDAAAAATYLGHLLVS
jgi:cupin fold WbuC family metalloprotein